MSWLTAQINHPPRKVEADLALREGEVLAILGPNGAGKSTILQIISGLLTSEHSRVTMAGRDLSRVPPHRRRITTLGQQAMLFPHLSLLDNVAFGPRAAGASRTVARERAREALQMVHLNDLAPRRPGQVSGGQAQRAAIARALAAEPELLLLDEPLSALDVDVAAQLRRVLREVLRARARTTIMVTHDLLDALALADRVLVVESGRVAEAGPVTEVLTRPRSHFGASIAGVNLVEGRITDGRLRAGDTWIAGFGDPAEGVEAVALFRPAAVAVHLAEPQGSPRNTFPVTVTTLVAHGHGVRIHARHPSLGDLAADVTPAAVVDLSLEPGQPVFFAVKAHAVELVAQAHPGA